MSLFRLNQPCDERLLCKAEFDRDVVRCPVNPMHNRRRSRTSGLRVRFKASNPRYFCYSWASEFLISEGVAAQLQKAGLSGFSTAPIESVGRSSVSRDFMEFRVDWCGEFVASTEFVVLNSYCPACGLLAFDLHGNPPWTERDLHSKHDFFLAAPYYGAFCSERACTLLENICGSEVNLVAAEEPFSHEIPRKTASMSWPPVEPRLNCPDLAKLWSSIRAVDVRGVLPEKYPGSES